MLFALVDCANFYCSCERLFDPSLRHRPVVVLSNNDGCVIARTEEVKALGVPMAAPYFQWKQALADAGVAVFSSNYSLYADVSRRVMQTLETFTPDVEVYSIDEAFLAFPAEPGRPDPLAQARLEGLARAIHERVYRWTGIPVRVSLAPTKTLAKIGIAWAKRRARAGETPAVCLGTGADLDAVLARVPVRDVWGIGWRWAPRLEAKGVGTALKLRDLDDGWVRKHLHVVGLRLVYELRGVSCLPLERAPSPRHSVVRTRSFGRAVTDAEAVREAVAAHAARAAEKLRAEGLRAGALHAFATTKGHGPGPHIHAAHAVAVDPPTNHTPALIKAALRALDACYREAPPGGPPYRYKKAGVVLTALTPSRQTSLFHPENPALDALYDTVDRLNARMGRRTAVFARTGVRPQRAKPDWAMLRDHPHAAYTTRRSHLPVARADRETPPTSEDVGGAAWRMEAGVTPPPRRG